MVIGQSQYYRENKQWVQLLRDALSYAIIFSMIFFSGIQSYINLQEGKFPFNTGILADMAYKLDDSGDIVLVCTLAMFFGLFLILGKRVVINGVDKKIYEAIQPMLRQIEVAPTALYPNESLFYHKPRLLEDYLN